MKKLFLALGLLLASSVGALAQVPCIGVGGVNSVANNSLTCPQEPAVASYAASQIGIVPASAATDIACMTGAANVVGRLESVRISGSAGTLVNVPVTLTKHVSLNSGGTPYASGNQQFTSYAMDSTNAAGKVTGTAWSGNPTINDAAPGNLDTIVVPLSLTGTTLGNPGVEINFQGLRYMQAPNVRKATEQLCINLNATSVSSGVVNVNWKWTESPQ